MFLWYHAAKGHNDGDTPWGKIHLFWLVDGLDRRREDVDEVAVRPNKPIKAPLTDDDFDNLVAALEGGLAFTIIGVLSVGVLLRGGVPVFIGPAPTLDPPPLVPLRIDKP